MSNAWAIGLYSYFSRRPEAELFRQVHDLATRVFQASGAAPTYIAADGAGYSGKAVKFGGRTHTKAVKSGFSDIHVISLVANPVGSKEPAYDSFCAASLSYVKESGQTLLCMMMEERFLPFGGERFEHLLESLVALAPWDFGYALCQPIAMLPEFHVLGLDGGAISAEDRRRLTAWYASTPEERLHKLRDVYPYLVVNSLQLHARVSETQTVADVVRPDVSSVRAYPGGRDLWTLKIRQRDINSLRDTLLRGGVLLS